MMSEKRYRRRAECPQCGYGNISHISPKLMREKFIGNEEEIDVLCPLYGTRHTGALEEDTGVDSGYQIESFGK